MDLVEKHYLFDYNCVRLHIGNDTNAVITINYCQHPDSDIIDNCHDFVYCKNMTNNI